MTKDFPIEEWERTRVRLSSEHFHQQLPHAGQVSDSEQDKKLLVEI